MVNHDARCFIFRRNTFLYAANGIPGEPVAALRPNSINITGIYINGFQKACFKKEPRWTEGESIISIAIVMFVFNNFREKHS